MDDYHRIIQLCKQTSYRGNDLPDLRNLYAKYINNKVHICLSCPGALRHAINVFKQHEQLMLNKIKSK
jgi:hypothetical protein